MTMSEFETLLGHVVSIKADLASVAAKLEAHCAAEERAARPKSSLAVLVATGAAVLSSVVAVVALLGR